MQKEKLADECEMLTFYSLGPCTEMAPQRGNQYESLPSPLLELGMKR